MIGYGAEQAMPAVAAAPPTGQQDAARDRRASPNKRLKLAAPGLGRIPFVPQRTSCVFATFVAPAGWGAAA